MNFTGHALKRLEKRLVGLVTQEEVEERLQGKAFMLGETWIRVKFLPKRVYLPEAEGDVIYAIVHKNRPDEEEAVVTVEVRGREQRIKGDHFFKH